MFKKTALVSVAVASLLWFALPAAAASQAKAEVRKTTNVRAVGPAETLSGKILMVDPTADLVVFQDSAGTPFDLVVTPSTRIEHGDRRISLQDLTGDTNQGASVRFVPERNGDFAKSIEMKG